MNPNDVFPRRNLGESDEWGRSVEERIRNVEYAAVGQKQGLSGVNRTSASSLQELSRQLIQVRGLYDDLADLYASIPKADQTINTVNGFGLNPGWTTVVQANLVVPAGATKCSLLATASGQLVSTTTTGVITSKSIIIIDGSNGPVVENPWFPGNGNFKSTVVPSWSRTFSVTPGANIGVFLQALADDYTSYGYNAESYAVLSTIATFST